jgi:hypothetical protein
LQKKWLRNYATQTARVLTIERGGLDLDVEQSWELYITVETRNLKEPHEDSQIVQSQQAII